MTKKILIVDDEPNIVISLEFLMKKEGFEVAVASDGEEALAKVASFNPDLILLDVMMPKNQASKSAKPCVPTRREPGC
jgi:DNA-binding response OmpR family regulator